MVALYQLYLACRYRELRGRLIAVVGCFAVLVGAGLLIARDVRGAQRFPFDPDDVESIAIEKFVNLEPQGSFRMAGGPQVAEGLSLLEQSGESIGAKSLRAAPGPDGLSVYYRVTIKLKTETAAVRYVDTYPITQHGVPGVEPGLLDSKARFGHYRSDAFVHWVEEVVRQHAGEGKK